MKFKHPSFPEIVVEVDDDDVDRQKEHVEQGWIEVKSHKRQQTKRSKKQNKETSQPAIAERPNSRN